MTTRFDPFHKVSCRYGAPMGRRSYDVAAHFSRGENLCARHQGGSDGYDKGGAYWGTPSNVWAVWPRGKGHEAVCYVRAWSREEAIRKAMTMKLDLPDRGHWRNLSYLGRK